MGILDDLLKKGAKEIAGELAKKVTDTLSDTLGVDITQAEVGAGTESRPAANAGNNVPVRVKLRNILGNQFPGYTFEEDVQPSLIGGPSIGMPYSFVVYEGQTARLFIMIIGRNTCAHKDYKLSKAYADYRGVELINFIEHFENTVPYITERLHNYL